MTNSKPTPSPLAAALTAAAKTGAESKTLWQSIVATALWAVAQAQGVLIPVEVLMVLIGGLGLKEAAGKVRAPVKPKE